MAKQVWKPTVDDIRRAEKYAGVLTEEQTAQMLGVTEAQFKAACKRNADLDLAYQRGRHETLALVGANLVKKALAGNVSCMIFYMKTQAKWWDKQRVEHSGPDGGSISVETAETARREVMGRLAVISKRLGQEGSAGRDDGGPRGGRMDSAEVLVDVLGTSRPISA